MSTPRRFCDSARVTPVTLVDVPLQRDVPDRRVDVAVANISATLYDRDRTVRIDRVMTFRQLALKIHLWSSFTFAGVIVVACLTGSVLVYRHEIDQALSPALYRATPGDVGWNAVWNTVGQALALDRGVLIRGPVDRGVYEVELGEALLPFTVHVDPGSGAVLGARDPSRSLVGWVFLLHFNLLGGEIGHQLVGLTGVALVLNLLTGVWLWWPTLRRIAFGFRVRWSRPWFVVNYDVHRVVGIVSLPVIVLVAATGTALVFYDLSARVIYGIFLTTPEAATPTPLIDAPRARGDVPLTLDETADLAVRLAPGARASSMYIPASAREPVTVWLRTVGDTRPNVGSWHAVAVGLPRSTVSAWLRRLGVPRRPQVPPVPVQRYEWPAAGDWLQVDITPLGRFGQAGHRAHGDRRRTSRGAGGEYGHGAVEDHRRLASVEVLDEQLGRPCAAFLPRAVAWLAARQGGVCRVLSDHGAGDRARAFRAACAAAAIRLLRTRPSTPRTNGKAERVIQTRLREWASVTPYRTSRDRRRALRRGCIFTIASGRMRA